MKFFKNKVYAGVLLAAICISLVSHATASKRKSQTIRTGTWYAYVTGTVTPPPGYGTTINPPVCVSNPNTPMIHIPSECQVTTPIPICCYYVEPGSMQPGYSCAGDPIPWYVVTEIAYGEYSPL